MVDQPQRRRRSGWWLLIAVLATIASAALIAPAAAVLVGVGWFHYLALRYDNHTGSCFMLSILVTLVLVTLATLVGFLSLFGR